MKWMLVWLLSLGFLVPGLAWADGPPHHQYTTVTKTATGASSSAADVALWTPTTGNQFLLLGCLLSARNASIQIELEVSDVDVITPVRFETTGSLVVQNGGAVIYESAEDAVLRYTVTGSGEWSIDCWGYENAVLD